MPKRDEGYMRAQRDAIARAALHVLLEKGASATSQRDICQAAGVSVGALYTHFSRIEDVIVAACVLGNADLPIEPSCDTWQEYIRRMTDEVAPLTELAIKRFRLGLEFGAKLAMMDKAPDGLEEINLMVRNQIERRLRNLETAGEISLPLGIEATTNIHMQMLIGASMQLGVNRNLDRGSWVAAFERGLSHTSGRAES